MNRELAQIYQEIIAPWGVGFNITIAPYFSEGVNAGHELTAYNVNKLYLCSRIVGNGDIFATVGTPYIIIYDALNAAIGNHSNGNAVWDAGAANMKYCSPNIIIENLYFSRIAAQRYVQHVFSGYRITRA